MVISMEGNNAWQGVDEEIKQRLDLLEAYSDTSSDWYWEQDSEFRFSQFVASDAKHEHISLTLLIGSRRWELDIFPTEDHSWDAHIDDCKNHRPFRNFEYEVIDEKGKLRCFSISGVPVFSDQGEFAGYRGIGTDITVQYQQRQERQRNTVRLSQVVKLIPVAGFAIDTEHRITDWNKACEHITGLSSEQLIGTRAAWRGFYPKPRPVLADLVVDGAPESTFQHYYGKCYRRSTMIPDTHEAEDFFPTVGGGRWLLFSATALRDKDETIIGAVETFQDISHQKKQEQQILRQAHFDSLTGLPNRYLANAHLSQFLSESKDNKSRVVVLLLDLDEFRKVNDILGHDVGDRLLVECALRLKENVSSTDTVARLAADEFIVVGQIKSEKEAENLAANLLKKFRKPFELDGRELLLTASIGIALSPDESCDAIELLRDAEMAMFYSKESGRNMYHFFSQEMNAGLSRRLQLEEQLGSALELSELYVCYQPVINIESGKVEGVEALLRWNNPTLGQVPPDEFIPIAEQTGLIISIGYFVLSETLWFAHRLLQDRNLSIKVAVNLSPMQLRDPKLPDRIAAELARYSLPGCTLKLEITEGVLLGNKKQVHQSIEKITELDVQLCLDDFGTGYSSLSYLKKYPFNILKIDRSFVQNFEQDDTSPALIGATIALAKALKLDVVAEGVETEAQHAYLKQSGCDFAQGYLFSKPLTKTQFYEFIDQVQINPLIK